MFNFINSSTFYLCAQKSAGIKEEFLDLLASADNVLQSEDVLEDAALVNAIEDDTSEDLLKVNADTEKLLEFTLESSDSERQMEDFGSRYFVMSR